MFKRINNKSFHRILLILSGDISLNPGPAFNSQPSCSNEWNVFKAKGIYLIHFNSLLPKIDEIRYIATRTNAAVIGIYESKHRLSLVILEVISVTYKIAFFRGKSNIFLLKFFCLKPIVSIIYRPPNQSKFLEL